MDHSETLYGKCLSEEEEEEEEGLQGAVDRDQGRFGQLWRYALQTDISRI